MDILTRNITVALILTATSPGRAYTNTARLSQEIPVLTWTYSQRLLICVQQGAIKTIGWTHWSFLWLHINFPIGSTRDYSGPPFKLASLNLSIKWHKTKMSCAKEVCTMSIILLCKQLFDNFKLRYFEINTVFHSWLESIIYIYMIIFLNCGYYPK